MHKANFLPIQGYNHASLGKSLLDIRTAADPQQ